MYRERNTQTGIHTRIDKTKRISSAYRHYGNDVFSSWAWETLVWDGDKIIDQPNTVNNADDVILLHTEILKEYGKFVNGTEY